MWIKSHNDNIIVDSDFMFVTNHPTLVECAKRCYLEFPTIVNALNEGGLSYGNTPDEYCRMDVILAKSRRGIGESSNLAQLAMTYYWTEIENNSEDEVKRRELYDNFVILSVLAQLIIDSSKRTYEVDALKEIDRIKKMSCMNPVDASGEKKDFPLFMKYTRSVPTMKNGNELPPEVISESKNKIKKRINYDLICPMNYLQKHLGNIRMVSSTNTIPNEDFFIKMIGKSNDRQVSKIVRLAKEYKNFLTANWQRFTEYEFVAEFIERTDKFYEDVAKVKIGNIVTMNRIIEIALGLNTVSNKGKDFRHLNAEKYSRLILKALYRADSEKFLANFC